VSDRDTEIIARLRRGYEAFNRGDFDAAVEMAHPDIEFISVGAQPPLRGVDQFRAWMEPDAFETQAIEPLELIVAGNKVLVRQRATARGASSGIEMEIDSWSVWTLNEDGLATRVEGFLHHQSAEAGRAAGLRDDLAPEARGGSRRRS
jgi:ketosteroid isomerase-like protein